MDWKNGRPDEWKNPNKNYSASLAGAYEAGADAILEGLRKGARIPDGEGGTYRLIHYLKPVKAKFKTAFIPV